MITQHYFNGMHMRIIGAPAPRDMIFRIHGLGQSGLCLGSIMSHPLLRRFTRHCADLFGDGKSQRPEEPLSFSQYADLPNKHLSLMNAGQVILAGHSMGGVIGTLLCERHYRSARRICRNHSGPHRPC